MPKDGNPHQLAANQQGLLHQLWGVFPHVVQHTHCSSLAGSRVGLGGHSQRVHLEGGVVERETNGYQSLGMLQSNFAQQLVNHIADGTSRVNSRDQLRNHRKPRVHTNTLRSLRLNECQL